MDRIYDAYNGEGFSSDFTRKTRDRLHWICSKVTGSCVLDVGCSQGIGPILLGRSGFKVLGLDINPEAISFAEGVLSKELPTVQESVRFACVNFAQYPEDGEKFDTVIFGEVLEHLPRPDKFIEKAVALLSPGGHIVVTVPFGINDDPDHRQTFYYSRINQYLYPNFEILEVRYFGHWIGFVGKKRDVAVATPTQVDYAVLETVENAVFGIERSLRDQVIVQRTRLQQQKDALATMASAKEAAEKKIRSVEAELREKIGLLAAERDEANRTCTALAADLARQTKRANHATSDYATMKRWYEQARGNYKKLANSKLGRLTLTYWKLKDGVKVAVRHRLLSKGRAEEGVGVKSRLRVLFPCGSGNGDGQNPFVAVLMQALGKQGVKCDIGAQLFWESDVRYDIVNIMWPEALWGWNSQMMPKTALCDLARRLDALKRAGTRIVYTRHNIRPHVDKASALLSAYSLIEASADVVIHMGRFSRDELLRRIPQSSSAHVVIPHHIYPRVSRSVSRKEARAWFGFSDQDKVVLSFGVFRNDAERALLMNAVRDSGLPELRVLAPRFSDTPPQEVKGGLNGRAVPEKMLPVYFAAADVVFLQRTNILNSGNLPMAYYFGRACVGPQMGNVGEILKETGNFTFDPGDRQSVSLSVRKALESAVEERVGEKNRAYADAHWHPDQIAQQVLAAYREAQRRNVRVPDVSTVAYFGADADPSAIGVSVVIRSKGESLLLRQTLQSVEEQDVPRAAIEVVTASTWEKGLAEVTKPLVMLLAEGDRVTKGFVKDLASCFSSDNVWVSVGRWASSAIFSTQESFFTSKVASRVPAEGNVPDIVLWPLMASAFGRIFRTDRLREYQKDLLALTICETDISAVERLVGWEGHLATKIHVSQEAYLPTARGVPQFVSSEVEKLSGKLVSKDVSLSVKRILAGRIQFLSDRLYLSVQFASEQERSELVATVDRLAQVTPFFNRSPYAARKAIAFCHNFPPAVDASSFVSSKRLREIEALEGSSLRWHVIAQDMSAVRPQDYDFPTFFSDFQLTSISIMRQKVGWAPVLQKPYVDAACRSAESTDAAVIFSRAFWIGSHMAAYQYKLKHPEVKWYAEFSDPVAYAVDNTVRPCPDKGPNWFETEQMVYNHADVIIFTNAKQRDYMLAYHPNQRQVPELLRRSVILPQPVLDHAFCNIIPYDYQIDATKINIAFFGTFYVNRKGDDLLALLDNPEVVLHVFTTKPEDFGDKEHEFKGRLRVNPTISHLEFLNLGSRFDYLFLNDATFVGGVNPFLPSKFADYKATQTPIIAKVQEGSTLSEIDDPLVIKVTSVSPDFVRKLHRK